MKTVAKTLLMTLLLTGCVPDSMKEKINEELANAQEIMGDWEFKKAIAQIELHKLRNGHYPNSLKELQFLSAVDSTIFHRVEYTRLDSVYELNLVMKAASLNGAEEEIDLHYPAEFWKGLGCVKSNLK